jgi:hypothetical protein
MMKGRILLPGEKEPRRGFLTKGLVGGALLLGGGAFFVTRPTRRATVTGPLTVLSADEASVLLAIADRLVPVRDGFPRPAALRVAEKLDEMVARMHPGDQKEVKQAIGLFESALTGVLFDFSPRTFTESPPEEQDRRLAAWRDSRVAIRRTVWKTLRSLPLAVYYGSPEVYAAVGYPGPPQLTAPIDQADDEERR